jgi:hypothetical protein
LIFGHNTVAKIGNQNAFKNALKNAKKRKKRNKKTHFHFNSIFFFQVGWVKADTKAIQAIGLHVITHNPRIRVRRRLHDRFLVRFLAFHCLKRGKLASLFYKTLRIGNARKIITYCKLLFLLVGHLIGLNKHTSLLAY